MAFNFIFKKKKSDGSYDELYPKTTASQVMTSAGSSVENVLSEKQNIISGVSDTEISYLNGVTSPIQNQLNTALSVTEGIYTLLWSGSFSTSTGSINVSGITGYRVFIFEVDTGDGFLIPVLVVKSNTGTKLFGINAMNLISVMFTYNVDVNLSGTTLTAYHIGSVTHMSEMQHGEYTERTVKKIYGLF